MKLFRITAAVVAAYAATMAQAQNVTLYGIVDTGVEYVNNASATGGSVVRVPSNTGSYTSRWGVRGEEDLGGGLKALVNLESGFNADTGTSGQGGRLFGRTAVVGLKGDFGTVTVGRQWTMTFYSMADTDLMGPNIYGIAAFDAYMPNARADNSIVYRGTFGGWSVGGSYSAGRDSLGGCAGEVAGNSGACREWSGLLKYDGRAAGLAFAYDEQRGGASGATAVFYNGSAPVALAQAGDKDRRYIGSGYLRFDQAKLVAGVIHRAVDNDAASVQSNLFYVGAAYNLTPALVIDGQLMHISNSDQDRNGSMGVLRAVHHLSKRTAVYVQGAQLRNSKNARYTVSVGGSNTPPAGANQTGLMVGVRHFF